MSSRPSAAKECAEKLVRDGYAHLPHRIAGPGERYGLLAAKFREEVAEVEAAVLGSPEFIEEIGDLVEVCYALGGHDEVEAARLAKRDKRGGFDRLVVLPVAADRLPDPEPLRPIQKRGGYQPTAQGPPPTVPPTKTGSSERTCHVCKRPVSECRVDLVSAAVSPAEPPESTTEGRNAMSKTAVPTMLSAEEAANVLGLDVFDLAVCLRRFAVDELGTITDTVRRGDERPNLGRFRRLLRAAEACEAAWDETLAAAMGDDEPVA